MGEKKTDWLEILVAAVLMVVMGILTVWFGTMFQREDSGGTMTAGELAEEEREEHVLNIWYYEEEFSALLEEAAQRCKEDMELEIHPLLVKEENYLENINEQNISGEGMPDIYLMNSTLLEKAVLAGLTQENRNEQLFCDENYANTSLLAVTYKGKLQAYPLNFDTSFLIYNTAYVAKEPENFDEIITYSNSVGKSPVENILLWDTKSLLYNYGFAGGYLEYGGKNGDDASIQSFTGEKLIQSMEYYQKLNQIFSIDLNTVTYEDVWTKFSEGKVVYAIVKTDAIRKLKERNSTVSYGVGQFPDLNTDLQTKALAVTNVAVINPYAKNRANAVKIAEYLSNDMAEDMYTYTGKLSVKKDIVYEDERFPDILRQYENAVNLPKLMEAGDFGPKTEACLNQIWQGADIKTSLETIAN